MISDILMGRLKRANEALLRLREQKGKWFDAWERAALDTVDGINERGRRIMIEEDVEIESFLMGGPVQDEK